jgi:N-acetylmuramoyl-L-alanine amidase/GAF domain-containing protein
VEAADRRDLSVKVIPGGPGVWRLACTLNSTVRMSANATNPGLGTKPEAAGTTAGERDSQTAAGYAPGREALQALLAFSSLHEQIRRRRGQNVSENPSHVWRAEGFVLDEVLQLVSERALAITGSDGVAIALAEGDKILCRAAAGPVAPDVGVRLIPTSGFAGACLSTGLIVRCDDATRDPRVNREACRRMGVQSMLAVPLVTEQGVIGLIAAFCQEAYGFNDSDVRNLSLLAELILSAMQTEEDTPAASSGRAASASHENDAPKSGATAASERSGEDTFVEPSQEHFSSIDSLRSALAPVASSEQSEQARPDQSTIFSPTLFSQPVEERHDRRILAALLSLALLALILAGLTLWWWRTHSQAPGKVPAPKTNASAGAPVPTTPAVQTGEPAVAVTESPESAVTAVRHWSSTDSTTVAIDMQEQAQYEAHRLADPERIYFDLRGTSLASGVPGTIEVDDPLLLRIRVAQASPSITRVVLETKNNPSFAVKLETNPYRLLIEIHSAKASSKSTAELDLFAPGHQAARNRPPSTPERGTWLAPPASQPLQADRANHLRIVVDAGHGGWDMGTVGRKGLLEKDLVLDIVARLGSLLSHRMGAEIVYTRHDDSYIPLEKRTEIANLAQADLFLSVHANYSDSPAARGVETYYTNTYSSARARSMDRSSPEALDVDWTNVNIREKVQQSRRLAQDVQQALSRTLTSKNPAVRNRGVKEASYVVLTGTTMPAILAEVSFVSSPADEAQLENAAYRQQIAEAVYKGISAYADSTHRMNLASASASSAGQ